MTAILKTTAIPKRTVIPNMKKNPLGFAMTCQDEDPFSGVGSDTVTVRIFYLESFIFSSTLQMEIPPHLLHETQCVEACRTSNSETEGFAVFDKQDKRCTCVAKSLRWNALVDNTESDCSSIRYKVASGSHSDITHTHSGL